MTSISGCQSLAGRLMPSVRRAHRFLKSHKGRAHLVNKSFAGQCFKRPLLQPDNVQCRKSLTGLLNFYRNACRLKVKPELSLSAVMLLVVAEADTFSQSIERVCHVLRHWSIKSERLASDWVVD